MKLPRCYGSTVLCSAFPIHKINIASIPLLKRWNRTILFTLPESIVNVYLMDYLCIYYFNFIYIYSVLFYFLYILLFKANVKDAIGYIIIVIGLLSLKFLMLLLKMNEIKYT